MWPCLFGQRQNVFGKGEEPSPNSSEVYIGAKQGPRAENDVFLSSGEMFGSFCFRVILC